MVTSDTSRRRDMIAGLAAGLVRSVRAMAIASGAAGTWVWGWFFGGHLLEAWLPRTISVLAFMILNTPALVLVAAWWGFDQIRTLPGNTRALARDGRDRTNALRHPSSSRRRVGIRHMVHMLWQAWSLISESKDLVFGTAAIVRMANPATGVIVITAILATIVLGVVTAGTIVIWIVTGSFGW